MSHDVLSVEIGYIQTEDLKNFIMTCINKFPSDFFTAPLGNLYPQDEQREEGLLIHTIRVTRLVKYMADSLQIAAEEKDVLLCAAILHDSLKMYRDDELNWVEDTLHQYRVRQHFLSCMVISREKYSLIMSLVESSHGTREIIPMLKPTDQVWTWVLPFANELAKKSDIFIELS